MKQNPEDDIESPPSPQPATDAVGSSAPGDIPALKTASAMDLHWMKRAIELAAQAAEKGEVPVGAVIVRHPLSLDSNQGSRKNFGQMIAETGNLKEANQDALGHAEVRAIQLACQSLNRWRLDDCTLYVTLEPCVMCSGAIIHARLGRVVFGTLDPKAGAVESLYQILKDPRLNHAPLVEWGVMKDECSHQLTTFFRELRSKRAGKRSDPGI